MTMTPDVDPGLFTPAPRSDAARPAAEHPVKIGVTSLSLRELLTYMLGDARTIEPGIDLILVARHLERIGDHATNIAEIIHFELTGEEIISQRPKLELSN